METWPQLNFPGEVFETRCAPIDMTFDGTMGVPASTNREYVPGLVEFYINGVRVTEDEFMRRKHIAAIRKMFEE